MRRILAIITAVALLCSGCGGRNPGKSLPDTGAAASAVEKWVQYGGWAGESLELQRRLVRWYGVNLRSEKPEPGFRDAYGSILAGPGGVMGCVEFPEPDAVLPVFHDGCIGEGFLHQCDTPFPIGDIGTTVLRMSGDQTALWVAWLSPEAGDIFRIHILDSVITYRVLSAEPVGVLPNAAYGEPQCLLVFDLDGENLVVVAVPEDS